MKIISLVFKNRSEEWEVKKIQFPSVTLLVGASGVGKTQILDAIKIITEIASGKNFPGVSWEIVFSDEQKKLFNWSGSFSLVKREKIFEEMVPAISKNPGLLKEEQLIYDDKTVFVRNSGAVLINGENSKLQLSRTESLLFIFRNEKHVSEAFRLLKRIHTSDYLSSYKISNTLLSPNLSLTKKNALLPFLLSGEVRHIPIDHLLSLMMQMDLPLPYRLAILSNRTDAKFQNIQKTFCSIFPTVSAIKISAQETIKGFSSTPSLKVSIKEKGVSRPVPQERISNGMLKTLFLIAEIQLMEPGSVFVIDEFENGLGINCIDILTDEILDPTNGIQFIITSHHPYIINNVPVMNWKVIKRFKGEILNYSPEELGIGNSKHDAFMQLLNSSVYNPR